MVLNGDGWQTTLMVLVTSTATPQLKTTHCGSQTTSMVIDTSEFVTNGDWKEGKLLIVLIAAEDKICKFYFIKAY